MLLRTKSLLPLLAYLALASSAWASQTENVAFRVLPAAKIGIDGKADDWDLSAGIFACDDVEEQRERFSVWLHAMYDKDNLYLLARWNDPTPMNNPGQTIADYGFAGDSLQFRTLTGAGTPNERGQHFTAWHGRDGLDVIKVEQGLRFQEGVVEDAKKTGGAQQAFTINADGKGYVQEIAVPWKLLTRDGQALHAGDSFVLTFEPNFSTGSNGRLSVKDLFKPGVALDRVFTFMSFPTWGSATLEAGGGVKPQAVRLADGREFPVKMENGVPVVDWTGLIKTKELAGTIPIKFTMPADGYISLNLTASDGHVARQLLNAAFFTKGEHEVKWDALTNSSWTRPGEPVPAGDYKWSALTHPGLGLKLRGWAANGGVAPWDSADGRGNWGGDHGIPIAVAADGTQVYLGWNGAEAGRAVLACDLEGRVLWGNKRGGIAGVKALAADAGVLYVLGGLTGADSEGANIYKLNSTDGSYLQWESTGGADLKIKALWPNASAAKPEKADCIAASNGQVFLSFTSSNLIAVVDGKSGKFQRTIDAIAPGTLAIQNETLFYMSGTERIEQMALKENGKLNPQLRMAAAKPNGAKSTCFALGKDYTFEGYAEPLNYIEGHSSADNGGARVLQIGRKGGRALLGAWQPDGVRFVKSMAVDADGKLWVAESDATPKRISVWNTKTGELVHEFFGATSYGALGGAISPTDPNIMAGQGCEWQLDPRTGRARCAAVITRDGMQNARFGMGSNGRLYLAVANGWIEGSSKVSIFERTGNAEYKLRSVFHYEGKEKEKTSKTIFWADENGDGLEQPNELTTVEGLVTFSQWFMNMAPDLTVYAGERQFKVAQFTACGAPRYDLTQPVKLPLAGLGSVDGRFALRGGEYGKAHTLFTCADLTTGQIRWTYPDNFNGVHGSHDACPPEVGMIRGSFGLAGTAKLPAPIGNVWMVATNVGEWHLLTEDGFYLSRLFEGDPLKVKWPAQALPGADMTRTPPGMGGEDFGGSITLAKDGTLYIQAGKTAFWNLEVSGLENVKAIPGGVVAVSVNDTVNARKFREEQLQRNSGTRRLTAQKASPKLTGNFDSDFKGAEIVRFQKDDDTSVRTACAWDEKNLYLAWDVRDKTPWTNGADTPESLYLGGDTVDFQLGTDAKADAKRTQAAMGDLRLSIGNFKGAPTLVLYRPVAAQDRIRKPMTFSSGVIKEYIVADVRVIAEAQIKVTKSGESYLVEAVVPWSTLEFMPVAGTTLRGDFGVTYGDPAGRRTRLRSYWSNQHTGLVDDAVFELMLEPRNWGDILFK